MTPDPYPNWVAVEESPATFRRNHEITRCAGRCVCPPLLYESSPHGSGIRAEKLSGFACDQIGRRAGRRDRCWNFSSRTFPKVASRIQESSRFQETRPGDRRIYPLRARRGSALCLERSDILSNIAVNAKRCCGRRSTEVTRLPTGGPERCSRLEFLGVMPRPGRGVEVPVNIRKG
jgi:hypothetical protein